MGIALNKEMLEQGGCFLKNKGCWDIKLGRWIDVAQRVFALLRMRGLWLRIPSTLWCQFQQVRQ